MTLNCLFISDVSRTFKKKADETKLEFNLFMLTGLYRAKTRSLVRARSLAVELEKKYSCFVCNQPFGSEDPRLEIVHVPAYHWSCGTKKEYFCVCDKHTEEEIEEAVLAIESSGHTITEEDEYDEYDE